MQIRLTDSKDLRAIDPWRFEELGVLHLQESLAADGLVCALDQLDALTEDGEAHLLADEVRVRPQLDQVCVHVAIAKLAHEALLNDFLVGSLVVSDVQSRLFGD